jgi:hypothetical protein
VGSNGDGHRGAKMKDGGMLVVAQTIHSWGALWRMTLWGRFGGEIGRYPASR